MIETEGLDLRYGPQLALRAVTLALPARGLTALVGHSGCGKSSLLYALSGLRPPTAGAVRLDGADLLRLPRAALYREVFAFVFQHHYLLPYLSALENALAAFARPARDDVETTTALLERLGLGPLLRRRASALSGGERQRVAVARALARPSRYLFADEPTAALDRASARSVHALLRETAGTRGVLLVTHDDEALALADRVIELRDGRVVRDDRVLRAHAA